MSNNLQNFIRYYLPAIIWAGIIYYFSSMPDLKVGTESLAWEIILRKAGHMAEYAVLFWFVWRLFYYGWNLVARDSFIVAFFLVILYAAGDEWHQTMVPGRSGKIEDLIFDAVSAFGGMQLVLWARIKKYRRLTSGLVAMALVVLFALEYRMVAEGEKIKQEKDQNIAVLEVQNRQEETRIESQTPNSQPEASRSVDNIPMPPKIKMDVPFTSQAPLGVWDAYHEEACEEASIIMAKYYLDKNKLNKDIAEKEIQGMIKYQIEKYGSYKDSNAEEMVNLAREYYGINSLKVVTNVTRQDIKKYLAQSKPIIVPAAGRLLGNPNYTAPGPLYHVLVLVGYDGDTIITNDPGTRKGQSYTYNINVLYNAIHDFPGKPEDIEKGSKTIIVIE